MASRQIIDAQTPNESPGQTWEKLWDQRAVLIDARSEWPEMLPSNNVFQSNKYKDTLVRKNVEKNYVNQLFFSSKNIKNIDVRLRYAVFKMSKGQYFLGPQNKQELAIIMRAIYTNYAQNLDTKIIEQVENLNKILITRVAPDLYSRVTQYVKYLGDANEGHKIIIARPVNVNNTGLKVLPMGNALGI